MSASVARYMICRTARISGTHADRILLRTFMDLMLIPRPHPRSKVTHIKTGPLVGEGVYNAFSRGTRDGRSKSCFSKKFSPCTILLYIEPEVSYLKKNEINTPVPFLTRSRPKPRAATDEYTVDNSAETEYTQSKYFELC